MSQTTAGAPTLELHFKPVSFWSGPIGVTLLVLLGALAGIGGAAYFGQPGLWRDLLGALPVLGAIALLLVLASALWARHRPPRRAPLRAFDTHLELPRKPGSACTHRVDYTDLLTVDVAGQEPKAILLLGTPRRLLGYPRRAFVEPDAIEQLMAEVRYQLARRPGGEELMARMAMRDAIGRAAWSARPRVTLALLASIAAIYFLERAVNDAEAPLGLLRFGANAPVLVADGQWFRLFAANFLHANPPHLYMNGLGLLTLGALLERLLGSFRFASIYLVAALGGSAASALVARAPLSVGASTAIFGLLGALGWLEWHFRAELPAGFRQSRRSWFFILGLNAALPLLVPQIDIAAHAGGFFAGALATRALVPSAAALRRPRPAPRGVRTFTWLLAALFAVALIQAGWHALGDPEPDRLRIESAMLSMRATDADGLKEIAWRHAIAEAPSRAELELALRAATSATTLAPEQPEVLDTLATVHYRLGEFERAIDIERRALALRDDAVMRSQLARFLDAQLARGNTSESGALELGPGASADAVSLRLGAEEGGEATLRTSEPYPQGAEIWMLARRSGELAGAFVIRFGPGAAAGERTVRIQGAPERGNFRLQTALVDTTSCRGCPQGSERVTFHPMHPDVAALPRAERAPR